MCASEDRLKSLRDRIKIQDSSPTVPGKIQASSLEGRILENLKLLKSLIRGEKVRLHQFEEGASSSEKNKNSAVEKLKDKIISEFLKLSIQELALFSIPKKYQEECFDMLIQAWRKRVYDEFSQTLTLVDLKFSKESFRAFIIALSLNISLKALRLDRCRLKIDKIQMLAVFIKVHPTITVLHLDSNPLYDEGLHALAEALVHNETLLHLSCNNTKLTDESLPILLKMIKRGVLQTLSVTDNEFSEKTKYAVVAASSEGHCVVTVE
jgi:hypothetical protein